MTYDWHREQEEKESIKKMEDFLRQHGLTCAGISLLKEKGLLVDKYQNLKKLLEKNNEKNK